ncbi:MAG: ABC transporter ATP-binding protein [Clostridia bacterium]|nr:ABC transporter ATP-binding protein [Clostridia bacterium]
MMKYPDPGFPGLAREALKRRLGSDVHFLIASTLGADNSYVNACLALGDEEVFVCREDKNGSLEITALSLDKLSEPKLVKETDCVYIEAKHSGEFVSLCRCELKDLPDVSQAVGCLIEVCERGKKPSEVKFVRKNGVCPRCGKEIPRGSFSCPDCAGTGGAAKRLWEFVKPHRLMLALSIALFFATTGINLIVPNLNRELIDSHIKSSDPASVTFLGLALAVGGIALANAAAVAIGIMRNNILSRVSTKTVLSIRQVLYTHLQRMSVSGIGKYSTGELLARLSGDTDQISNFLTGQLPALIEQLMTLFVVGGYLFITAPALAAAVIAPVPLVFVIFRVIWRMTARLYRRQWVVNSEANTVLHDIFRGIRVVKIFGTEKKELAKYETAVRRVRDISIKNETVWARIMPYANFILGIGSYIVLYFVGSRIIGGEMTVGQLTMYSGFVSMLYAPIRFMARLPRMIQRTVTSISKVMDVIEDESILRDEPESSPETITGNISVENISFGYSPAQPVLKDVSVSVGRGEMLGIVGRSGVGKSTLINLIMRLYDVDSGRICVDGLDVRSIPQNTLRKNVGVVLQENFLFTGTIYDNIAYAKPEASPAQVIEAAKKASAHSFIMKLPDGYNSMVGESGCTLSGGERQRIAIARAILHDPKILILDEATSSLDTETEKEIQDALANLIKDRTTVAIAHRLSTLRNATKLLVLDKGTAAELGTHEELMKKRGIYYGLVMAQRQMNKVREQEPS